MGKAPAIRVAAVLVTILRAATLFPADCNRNGVEDPLEIASGSIVDCDADGIPDECAVSPVLAWETPLRTALSTRPARLTPVDLDRDGRLDLLVTSWNDPLITAVLADGAGSFRELPPVQVSGTVSQLAAGDLNGDQHPDLAVASHLSAEGGGLSVLMGRGDGSFGPPAALGPREHLGAVAREDFNRDGIPDLAAAGGRTGAYFLSVFFGKGDGTFDAPARIVWHDLVIELQAVDFNGDQTPDLLFRTSSAHEVLVGRGDGTFAETDRLAIGSLAGPATVSDFDRDGALDVALPRGTVTIWPGNGDGTFGPEQAVPVSGRAHLLSTPDLNADSIPDLVAGDESGGALAVLLGKGDGDFTPGRRFLTGGDSAGMVAGDFDGDGAADIAVTGFQFLSVLRGTGDGSFRAGQLSVNGDGWLGSGDFDGDGRPDLVAVGEYRGSLYLGEGNGGLRTTASFSTGDDPHGVALTDLNDDARHDLVVTSPTPTIEVFLAKGDGTVETAGTLEVYPAAGAVVAADFDGDRVEDLATTVAFRDEVAIFRATSPASFGPPVRFAPGAAGIADLLAFDLDRDGDLELVAAAPGANRILVLPGDGRGGFLPSQDFGGGWSPSSIAAGDLNGDGYTDLVAAGGDFGRVAFLPGRGDGTFGPTRFIPTSGAIRVASSDLDGDGTLDLLLEGSPDVAVLVGRGDGTFQRVVVPLGADPVSVLPVELDGDGLPELAATHFRLGMVSVTRNRTRPLAAPDCNRNRIPDACDLAGGGSRDLDGDGVPDECEADCDGDGIPDDHQIATGASRDCDADGIPDACAIASGRAGDCNRNGVPDDCDLRTGTESDANGNGVPDRCDVDCDADGVPDDLAIRQNRARDCNKNGVPDLCDIGSGRSGDCDRNGIPDECAVEQVLDLAAGLQTFLDVGEYRPAAADLDADGLADLALARWDRGDVVVLLGKGGGELDAPRPFPVGPRPAAVIVADLDGDAAQDLITPLDGTEGIAVLPGHGEGSFGGARRFPGGQSPHAGLVADVNGDGVPDVVTANSETVEISVFLGTGGGSLALKAASFPGTAASAIAALDADADGRIDLAASDASANAVVLFRGQGDGTFTRGWTRSAGGAPGPLATFDANGDGHGDLLATSWDTTRLLVLSGKGDGTFTLSLSLDLKDRPVRLLAGDFDGDGDFDAAVGLRDSGEIAVFRSGGAGVLAAADRFRGCGPFCPLAAADLDGDGKLDLLQVHPRALLAFPGNGDATFRSAGSIPAFFRPEGLVIGDLDLDGKQDLAVGSDSESRLSLAFGVGAGVFSPPVTLEAGRSPYALVAADLDRDGLPDLAAAASRDNLLAVLLNGGGRAFRRAPNVTTGRGPVDVVAADLDGDGVLDLASCDSQSYGMSVFRGEGDGTFRPAQTIGLGWSGESRLLALDADANGFLDLLINLDPQDQRDRSLALALNRGDGTLRDPRRFTGGDGARDFAAADLDGDGKLDLVDVLRNGVAVLAGHGDGTFGAPTLYAAREEIFPMATALADLDGDRITDVAYTNLGGSIGSAAVRLGRGDGTLGPERAFIAGGGPQHLAAGDLDGDGRIDLATSNYETNDLSLVFNRSLPRESPDCNSNGIPDNCDLREGSSRDADGNGIPDDCQPDCNRNDVPDAFEISSAIASDCNRNKLPDDCDLAAGEPDRNLNGLPDGCETWSCRVPGDGNGDGVLNIVDPIFFFQTVFVGAVSGLPCGTGLVDDPGNLALLDWQGDRRLDITDAVGVLSFLFLGGPPHPLAVQGAERTACVAIFGCAAGGPQNGGGTGE